MDDIFGIGTGRVVPVLPVAARLVAVVIAQVVATTPTVAAVAAASMASARHAVADSPTEFVGACTQVHDCAGPLVTWRKRVPLGPETLVVAVDDMWISAADV